MWLTAARLRICAACFKAWAGTPGNPRGCAGAGNTLPATNRHPVDGRGEPQWTDETVRLACGRCFSRCEARARRPYAWQGECMIEAGMLSIVRRRHTYEVRYASSNPYDMDQPPSLCSDEGALVTLLHHYAIDAWSLDQAMAVLRKGGWRSLYSPIRRLHPLVSTQHQRGRKGGYKDRPGSYRCRHGEDTVCPSSLSPCLALVRR